MSSRLLVALLAVVASALSAPAAFAKAPAPGAPGAKHTWAPADKHGFGTARQARSHVWFTLREAALTEVYYPDLSTPSFRGLQFVVTDGRTSRPRDRRRRPGHIEPVARASRASSRSAALDVPPDRRATSRWRLTKTWITDPARATVLARVQLQSLTAGRCALRARRPGARRRRQRRPRAEPGAELRGLRRRRRERRRRAPAADARRPAATAAAPSDPWTDLQADGA